MPLHSLRCVNRFLAGLLLTAPAVAQPVITAVVNAASFEAGTAPGSIVSIFGTGLADRTAQAATVPLSTNLGGTRVTLTGDANSSGGTFTAALHLYYVSPNQVNAVMPDALPPYGTPFSAGGLNKYSTITVTTSSGTSKPYAIEVRLAVPGLFTKSGDGTGQALIFNPDFSAATDLLPGHSYIVYAAGLGTVSPFPRPGDGGASSEPLNRLFLAPVQVVVGEQEITPDFAGIAPGMVYVYQINFTLPADFAPATDRIFVRSPGWQSNTASFPIASSNLVAQGTVQALFPYTPEAGGMMRTLTIGLLLEAGKYSLQVNLPSTPQPVRIAAVTDAGSTVVRLDWNGGGWSCRATQTAPPVWAHDNNFSYLTTMPILDFSGAYSQSAVPFPFMIPANLIPVSILDPVWPKAVAQLPAAGTSPAPQLNGTVNSACTTANGVFAVNDTSNVALSRFGGFRMLPYAPFPTRTSTFRLYANGQLIAQDRVTYPVLPVVLAN